MDVDQDELGVTGAEFFCSPIGNHGWPYTNSSLKFVDHDADGQTITATHVLHPSREKLTVTHEKLTVEIVGGGGTDWIWTDMLHCPGADFPRGLGLAYQVGLTTQIQTPIKDRIGLLYPIFMCKSGEVEQQYKYEDDVDRYSSNDMDCDDRRGIKGVNVRLHKKPHKGSQHDGLSINSFAITCTDDDEVYQKNLALSFLPYRPDASWVTLVPSGNSYFPTSWLDAQACQDGTAVFAVQPRSRNQYDGVGNIGGITGLRFYCSTLLAPSHQVSTTVLEFPGMIGDWGARYACNDGEWLKGLDIEYLEVRQRPAGLTLISLSCASANNIMSTEGRITPYPGTDPASSYQGDLQAGFHSHASHHGRPCDTGEPYFIGGVTVKEHYYNPSTTRPGGANFQGLVDLAYVCNVYGNKPS